MLAGLSWRWTCLDGLLSGASFVAAYLLRFDGRVPEAYSRQMVAWLPWVVLIRLGVLLVRGDLRISARNVGQGDLVSLVLGNALTTLALFLASMALVRGNRIPFGVLTIDLLAASFLLVGARVSARWILRKRLGPGSGATGETEPVLLAGTLDGCAGLAEWLQGHGTARLRPVGILVEDAAVDRRRVHGIRVWGGSLPGAAGVDAEGVHRILLVPPLPDEQRMEALVGLGRELGARLEIASSPDGSGTGEVARLTSRPLSILDLLGRGEVTLDREGIRGLVHGRRVLVTGAGGSIGSELCRQILALKPSVLVLSERAEPRLFEITQELAGQGGGVEVVPTVVDVSVESAVDALLGRHRPEIVFHAAAHKHVPLMESQPGEAIRNNTLATATLVRAADRHGVDKFVMISTDKAINPSSAMGASKRLAEAYLQAFQAERAGRTRFMAVRFGNVLGSSGSVVGIFERQIALGGPVTVTHPDVRRYFMTVGEAVGLVLQSAFLGEGGEIFVLDMGEPVRIADLAAQMIELSGLRPGEDVRIEFTGLRPGEKLFEELSHDSETHKPTAHAKVFRFLGRPVPLREVEAVFSRFETEGLPADAETFRRQIEPIVPEYSPPGRGQG